MAVVINAQDVGKTDIELLMDLIYETAGIRVPEQKITYGKPTVLDVRPDITGDSNTFIPIVIDADYDDRFPADAGKGLLYRRRELSEHFSEASYTIFTQLASVKLYAILSQLNAVLSYPLTTKDVLDQTIDTSEATSLTILANPDSYIWTGSAIITVNIIGDDLVELLTISDLEGF
jgi:hypothetical protein